MDAETSQEAMRLQLAPVHEGALAREYGWTIESEGLVAWVTLVPRRKRERKFLLRIGFESFPMIAPTYGFARSDTKLVEAAAAPPNVLHSSGGICCPGTREFHESLHKNDAAHPWSSDRYPVCSTLQNIQKLMERGVGS